MYQQEKKKKAAEKAYEIISSQLNEDSVLGIGTGSTTNYFIDILAKKDLLVKGAVCSSKETEKRISESGVNILGLNDIHKIDFYIDGADEFNSKLELIKGGGGALTREKILANSSESFICIVDESKEVNLLGNFPLPIEVIEIARSAISREIVKMGGKPVYRNGFVTDNGNQIIDVKNLEILVPFEMEKTLNNIPGVVENGIFAKRPADIVLKANDKRVLEIRR